MKKRCLVVGGGGFLGRHIVEELLENDNEVAIFDIRQTYSDARAEFIVGDMCNAEELKSALRGVEVVFHCATPPPLSSNRSIFHRVNVYGTGILLAECRKAGVRAFILTSSASVIYEGKDLSNALESHPYARCPVDYYSESKIEQEKLVLAADDAAAGFRCLAIRPHGIFGPRDPLLVPTLSDTARNGKSRYILGDGQNIVDFTYVGNVAYGHFCAMQALLGPRCNDVGGQAFHITNDEPIKFWDFMTRMLVGLGYAAPHVHLPRWLMVIVAMISQFIAWLLSPIYHIEMTLSPLKVALLTTHHYYNCDKAKKKLGYKPRVNMTKGIDLTVRSFPQYRNPEVLEDGKQK